jgi:hypothetical protein
MMCDYKRARTASSSPSKYDFESISNDTHARHDCRKPCKPRRAIHVGPLVGEKLSESRILAPLR